MRHRTEKIRSVEIAVALCVCLCLEIVVVLQYGHHLNVFPDHYFPSFSHVVIFLIFQNYLIISWVARGDWGSITSLYYIPLILYFFSTFFLYLIEPSSAFAYWRYIDELRFIESLPYLACAACSYTLGILLGMVRKGRLPGNFRKWDTSQTFFQAQRTEMVIFGLLVCSIMIVFIYTLLGMGLSPMLDGNYNEYSNARKFGEQSLLYNVTMTQLLPLSSISFFTFSIARRKRIGLHDAILIIPVGIFFVAGDRGTLLALLATLTVVYGTICRRIQFWQLALGIVLLIMSVPLIELLRSVGPSAWTMDLFLHSVADIAASNERHGGNFYVAILGPFSPSQMTFVGSLMLIDGGMPYRLGADYVGNIAASVPFNSRMAANNSQQIHDFLIPGREGGPGFMAVAEMYVNFGLAGILVGHAVLGYILEKMRLALLADTANPMRSTFVAFVFFASVIWVRNEFSYVAQTIFNWVVLFWLVPGIILWLCTRRSNKLNRSMHKF